MKIVCVGGGPAGLYFAILMKRYDPGHEITVLERNPPGRTYGWGVVFWDDLVDSLRAADRPTAEAIESNAFGWVGERLVVTGSAPVQVPGRGWAIGRRRLLELLLERAQGLGVDVRFNCEVENRPDADLVLACDGAGSRLRQANANAFKTEVRVGRNKYLWLGTTKVFNVFTFSFVPTDAGWIWCHAYGFDKYTSTFIVECSAETWAGLGFDRLGEEDTLALLRQLFAVELDGHPLRSNGGAQWLSFRTLTNECWDHENIVLMGDAAHTTHFTIGSGTKLALEDAVVLAGNLSQGGSLQHALASYGRERRRALRRAQTDARFSAQWFESVPRYAGLEPEQLFALLHERRSPLLPRIPPPAYYRLHQATHDVAALRRLRGWAAPKIKALYGP